METMETATHIHDLPSDVLARILWHSEESTPWKSDSDALWSRHSLYQKPLYLRSIVLDEDPIPEEESYPVLSPSAGPTATKIFLVSSVCRRWRDVAHRDVSTLLVERKHAISLQQLSNAVACFPNLNHLHLCDDSVETLNDSFLAHLASSCPQLKTLHVGRGITQHREYVGPKHKHPITEAGLDRFFQRCTQLEQLSLLCLHRDTELPASFFHLTRLHTLAVPTASALEALDLETLGSLTTLHIASPELTEEQLANVRRLSSITCLSLSPATSFSPASGDSGSAALAIAQLPLIKSLDIGRMVLSDWPCTSLERLRISGCGELERLPDSIAELLPRLRELTVSRCDALEELPEGFCSLEHFETLSVIECGEFRRVPESIGRLAALKTLVLEELPLSSLPDSMCQLGSLETFFLLSCKSIRELPADFCCLTALTTLCLGYVALPADMGRLSNLHTLLVRDILGHKHLPCSLSEVASLTRLELLLCGVEELPEGVGDLSSLRELHVSWCPQLTALPASVTDLTALEALSLADCENLASVPTRLDGLTRLKRLEVARCDRLTQPPLVLPASVEWLSWGNYSQAMALPEVSRLTGLGTLRLDVVAVACGVAVSRSLSHVEHLRLSLGGNAEELPFALTFLSRLRTLIIDCAWSLQRLPADIGSAVPQLRKLLLISAYKLRELPASVSALQNLTSLGVFDAPNLASLPPAIGALSGLRELLIGSCKQLEQLPASLTQLARLNQLTISNCPIRSLCPTAAQFQRLRSLSLSGCAQLEALPGDLGELKALRMLDVYDCRLVKDSVGSVLPRSINEVYGLRICK